MSTNVDIVHLRVYTRNTSPPRPHCTEAGHAGGHLGGLGSAVRDGRGRQQVGDRVVEARQVDRHPGAQEHDVAQQGLVLKRRPEGAVLRLVHARSDGLQPKRVLSLRGTSSRACTHCINMRHLWLQLL